MKPLSLSILTLFTVFNISHAQQGNIDMHGKASYENISIFYGEILEIKSAKGYKYLKVNEKGKHVWVAIADAQVSVGENIGFDKNTLMTNFTSATLNQTFEEIYFSSNLYLAQKSRQPKSMKELLGLSGQKNSDETMAITPTNVPQKSTANLPFVEKESYTVKEVYLWREQLQNRTITLKGTISKISTNIMQRNWVHIGDGTGNQANKNNNLVFTTNNNTVSVNEYVVAKGKVTINKDFGYGYFYPVIIENTTFEGK